MSEMPERTVTSAPASLATTPMDRANQIPTGSKSEQRRNPSSSHRLSQRKKELARRRIQSDCDTTESKIKSAQEQLTAELNEDHAAMARALNAATEDGADSASLSALPIPARVDK